MDYGFTARILIFVAVLAIFPGIARWALSLFRRS